MSAWRRSANTCVVSRAWSAWAAAGPPPAPRVGSAWAATPGAAAEAGGPAPPTRGRCRREGGGPVAAGGGGLEDRGGCPHSGGPADLGDSADRLELREVLLFRRSAAHCGEQRVDGEGVLQQPEREGRGGAHDDTRIREERHEQVHARGVADAAGRERCLTANAGIGVPQPFAQYRAGEAAGGAPRPQAAPRDYPPLHPFGLGGPW